MIRGNEIQENDLGKEVTLMEVSRDLTRVIALMIEAESLDKERDKQRLAEIKNEVLQIAERCPIFKTGKVRENGKRC